MPLTDPQRKSWLMNVHKDDALSRMIRQASHLPRIFKRSLRPPRQPPRLALFQRESLGEDRGQGNLLGLYPWMENSDYSDISSFVNKCQGYLQAARELGWLHPKSLVVFPAQIGTFLFATDEISAVYQSKQLLEATQWIASSRPLQLLKHALLDPQEPDHVLLSQLLQMKATRMAQQYHTAFSQLARQFGVALLAGSLLLPAPYVASGQLCAGVGPLEATCPLYHADGQLDTKLLTQPRQFSSSSFQTTQSSPPQTNYQHWDTPIGPIQVSFTREWEAPLSSNLTLRVEVPTAPQTETSVPLELELPLSGVLWGQSLSQPPLARRDQEQITTKGHGAALFNLWR